MNKDFILKYNFITNTFFLLLIVFGGLVWADTNGIWHLAEDVRPGVFGSDEGIISGYSFVNPLSLNAATTYYGVELDTRFVNEAQANSVSSGMIVDGSIGIVDVNSAQIQVRVSGTCPAGQSIRAISSTGTVTCEVDDSGIASESDPTVLASVKDGVSWSEVSGIPAGFADGVDNGITAESDPQVGTLTNGKWCTSNGVSVNCVSDAPSSGAVSGMLAGTCHHLWIRDGWTGEISYSSCSAQAPLYCSAGYSSRCMAPTGYTLYALPRENFWDGGESGSTATEKFFGYKN